MQDAFEKFLQSLPLRMQPYAASAWKLYELSANQHNCPPLQEPQFLHGLWLMLASSDYVTRLLCQTPSLAQEIQPALHRDFIEEDYFKVWEPFSDNVTDEITLMQALRKFSQKYMLHIIWRELLGLSSFDAHLQALSSLADVCVKVATDFLYKAACQQFGTPCNEQGQPQPFVVVAVGKLGASELNLSSDIDLIFTYPEEGVTLDGPRKISNQQFFTKIGQQLIKVLAEITNEGFVYRVDMRLRPHGQSGSLVLNFNAIENYYQYHGRDWERYALIKARVITGDEASKQRLYALLQPFIYRRYLDYGAFESLREMRDLVALEVKRKQIKKNIKLGPGGIRQIEFLAQAFQLIRGGQHRQFQHRQLLVILARLAQGGLIEERVCKELESAYIFLRKSEHRLQLFHNQQTHVLPTNALDKERLYFTMGYTSWGEYQRALKTHTQLVENHFNHISSSPHSHDHINTELNEAALVWSKLAEASFSVPLLEKMGYVDAKSIYDQLLHFKESRTCQNLKKHASLRLDKIMPVLIFKIAKIAHSSLVIERMLRLMQSITRRSAYLSLLLEKPKALDYLIHIAHLSEWILSQLCDYPILLDELLSPPSITEVTSREYLEKELNERLSWLPANDLEGQMDHLRQFKMSSYLHLALLEIDNQNNSLDIYAALNNIVEIILNKIMDLSIDFMISHFQLTQTKAALKEKIPFAIVAYGKLGAGELTYQSDLDLVFLYTTPEQSMISGKMHSHEEYALRLAQRIIHMLSTHTACGTLYEVDVRLRPGGSAGLLVSHFEAFKKYLHEKAWTWEHQALVKARVVAGASLLDFEKLRADILTKKRDPELLAKEIKKMREKMHEHRYRKNEIKMVKGGLADIDFIAQYFMLLKANECPSLLTMRSSTAIVETLLKHHLIQNEDGALLLAALHCYQQYIRRKIFQPELALSEDERLNDYLGKISLLWQRIFNNM